uniref:Cholesteryl ester transfer protein, plasma n=1 Tax=Salarias fasciatus TaxID=181472 RepID=A0A672I2H3_SALFA
MARAPGGVLLLLLWFWFWSWFSGSSLGCLQDPAAAYRLSGAVCRLTHPAAVVLNEKTTRVIEAAFQSARYPRMAGEKAVLFVGKVLYGLDNLEISNLTIGRSDFRLLPGVGIAMEIQNVSAVFRGMLQYGYGTALTCLVSVCVLGPGLCPPSDCGGGKVAADTSDCYLNFHKLLLHLQGDKQPNWLKKLFTNFITFTVKLVIKGQICQEINKVANILAEFIQDTAGHFLSDGDISVDIGVTAAPVITENYIESYHKVKTPRWRTMSSWSNPELCPVSLWKDHIIRQRTKCLFSRMFVSDLQDVVVDVKASYADKKLFLHGILEVELTRLLDKQGANLFDILNPELLPRDGFVLIQMDFGFPHHLLVEFLKKTLQ